MNEKAEVETLDSQLANLEPPYESDNEARIGRLLDKYGIPFFYKQATIVYDQGKNQISKPSFTLVSYGGAVIDYIAAAGEQQVLRKEQLYRYNQIPAVVVGPKDLDKPNWDKDLYDKLKQVSQRPITMANYTLDGKSS
jgi:hypothetical protein